MSRRSALLINSRPMGHRVSDRNSNGHWTKSVGQAQLSVENWRSFEVHMVWSVRKGILKRLNYILPPLIERDRRLCSISTTEYWLQSSEPDRNWHISVVHWCTGTNGICRAEEWPISSPVENSTSMESDAPSARDMDDGRSDEGIRIWVDQSTYTCTSYMPVDRTMTRHEGFQRIGWLCRWCFLWADEQSERKTVPNCSLDIQIEHAVSWHADEHWRDSRR